VVLSESPHLPVTLSDLAYILGLERTYCCKVFQQFTGISFSRWIRGIRIAHAQHLLDVGKYMVTDVAHPVGYGDITTFERNFRKEAGTCPTDYIALTSQFRARPQPRAFASTRITSNCQPYVLEAGGKGWR
jgi:YesN/AraC family two-component response regulator